jgi:DNA-binding response OmpR family regulator
MRPEVAQRRIQTFRERFGEAHFALATHAAFPLALTPDLLYQLWANFQQDIHGEILNIPWLAVSDLLLSSLCDEVGHELYEMPQKVRNSLLAELKTNSRFGSQRINELSVFLLTHVKQQLESHDSTIRDFAQAQRWTALSYTQPTEAVHEIASTLAALTFQEKTEWIRMASLVETFAEPLSGFEPLLTYVRGIRNFAHGDLKAATEEISKLRVIENNSISITGVSLSYPENLLLHVQSPSSNTQLNLSPQIEVLEEAKLSLDAEKALQFVEELLSRNQDKSLNDLERMVFLGSWIGKSYKEILHDCNRRVSLDHLVRNVGPRLWKLIGEALGENVRKGSLRGPIERAWRLQSYEHPVDTEEYLSTLLVSRQTFDRARILVVDNGLANRSIIQAILEKQGYQVHLTDSGNSALSMIGSSPPDLLILEIFMPGMDGYEVTRRLRQDTNLPYLPILLISAHEKANLVKGLDLGADDFIRKPVDVDELLARVRLLLRLKRNIDERNLRAEITKDITNESLEETEVRTQLRPARILVVDPDPAIRTFIHRFLTEQNYQVESAEDGKTALAIFEGFNPDLVLLEVNLHDSNGHILCQEMQSRTGVFVILLTTRSNEADKIRGFSSGADDYITKPFSLGELGVRVGAVLKRQRPVTNFVR